MSWHVLQLAAGIFFLVIAAAQVATGTSILFSFLPGYAPRVRKMEPIPFWLDVGLAAMLGTVFIWMSF